MIAAWMGYAAAIGALAAGAAWIAERVARRRGWPTRWVWLSSMLLTLAVTVRAVVAYVDVTPPEQRFASFTSMDSLLLGGWALLTAFLGGVFVHAFLEGRRLRAGLDRHVVDDTPVLITEGVGPAAINTGPPSILLPRWTLDLDGRLVSMILRHEREHLAARDPLLLFLGLLSAVLVPWQLPLWWSWQRLRLATEVDCDSRVLRANTDLRRYAELLLLIAQRSVRSPWASRPVFTVVAPLQSDASQLSQRIHVMTQHHAARSILRTAFLLAAAVVTGSLAFVMPTPTAGDDSAAAIVKLHDVGLLVPDLKDSLASPILVYATGPARIAIGSGEMKPLRDTLKFYRFPAMTFDVTDADIHIQMTQPGNVRISGTVTGGGATSLFATGPHLVLIKGGDGVEFR